MDELEDDPDMRKKLKAISKPKKRLCGYCCRNKNDS